MHKSTQSIILIIMSTNATSNLCWSNLLFETPALIASVIKICLSRSIENQIFHRQIRYAFNVLNNGLFSKQSCLFKFTESAYVTMTARMFSYGCLGDQHCNINQFRLYWFILTIFEQVTQDSSENQIS